MSNISLQVGIKGKILSMFFRMMYECSILVHFRALDEINKITSPTIQSLVGDKGDGEKSTHCLPCQIRFFYPLLISPCSTKRTAGKEVKNYILFPKNYFSNSLCLGS